MKKYLIVLTLFLTSTILFGQTEKGKIQIGGELSYLKHKSDHNTGTEKTDLRSYSNMFLNANVGYFVTNKFVLGIMCARYEFKTAYQQTTSSLKSTYDNPNYYLGPYVRYYKMLGNQLGIFGQAFTNFSTSKIIQKKPINDTELETQTDKTKSIGASINPGFVFFPTKRIGLELSFGGIGYSHILGKQEYNNLIKSTNDFYFDFDFRRLGIGLMFYL